MKNIVLTGLLVLLLQVTHAQQQPHYTQYIMNPFIINPALAGIENYWDLRFSHRHQWVGMKGAPVTTYMTLQGPLYLGSIHSILAWDGAVATGFHQGGRV